MITKDVLMIVILALHATSFAASTNANDGTSFLVIADMHSMSEFAFEDQWPSDSDYLQQTWNDLTSIVENIKQNYADTEIVLAPGDITSFGKMSNDKIQNMTGIEDENDAVYHATMTAFGKTNELYQGAGFTTFLPCLGDHEIGGNKGFRVDGKRTKFSSIDSYRQAWIDSFMMSSGSNAFKFQTDINGVSSRPYDTDFEGTSYAYKHKNSLFITLDIFLTVNGAENYFDRENGYGGEGAITCSLQGNHLQWFENVLIAARNDDYIKHIFVQAHVPIQHPVRKARCSGQFLDDQTESDLWKLMEKYNVDIYFAGEVHATTATKSKSFGSSLVQIVSSAKHLSGFLTVDTSDDIITVKQFKEVGSKQKYNNEYTQNGFLTINKSDASNVQISSGGELEILDDLVPLIHFDFEAIRDMSERQVDGMQNDDSLIAHSEMVGNMMCLESIHNNGSFGQQYDSQITNIDIVQGRNENTLAGKFSQSSRMGVHSVGPFTAGMVHSISFWMKTGEASKEMVLLYFGPDYKSSNKDSLRITLNNGNLEFRFTRSSARFRLVEEKMLADNQWHQIVMSMPYKSCKYSEVDIYIDGKKYESEQIRGNDNYIFFHTDGRLNVGGYGYAKYTNVDDSMENFVGEMDDIKIWSKSFEKAIQSLCWNKKQYRFATSIDEKSCKWLCRSKKEAKVKRRQERYCKGDVSSSCCEACNAGPRCREITS